MAILQEQEWKRINDIASKIGGTNSLFDTRSIFLAEISRLVSYDLADFCLCEQKQSGMVHLTSPVINSIFSKNYEEQFTQNYEKIYEMLDYTKWIFSNPESIVYKESEIIGKSVREKTPYYVNYLKPLGLINVMGVSLADNGIPLGAANFYRSDEKGDYSDKDLYILEQFIPHLRSKLLLYMPSHNTEAERTWRVLHQKYDLSRREVDTLRLICDGKSNNEIGEMLYISPNTVKKHVSNILLKLNVENRIQLINHINKNDSDIFL